MIVNCPNCATRLQLDESKVPARPFSVRCPKCQQIINAQPPTAPAQRDALGAVGDVPSSLRPQQETAAPAAAAPLVGEPQPPAVAAPDAQDDVLRLLASLLRREAAGGEPADEPDAGRRARKRRRALMC